jgi:hypothetical protein
MNATTDAFPRLRRTFLDYALLVLVAEKIIQHILVSLAFYLNWADIESTVVVHPTILLVLGSTIAALFCVAFWGLIRSRSWAINLVLGLALFDIIGEFIAQGTLMITIPVSFLVACVLVVLAIVRKHQQETSTHTT